MHKVLITTSSFGKNDSRPAEQLQGVGLEAVMNPFGRKLTEEEVLELIESHQPVGMIAGVEPLTPQVLSRATNLKVISRCGIGMDSINTATAEERCISLRNTPDAPTIPVAELTLGMILSLLRKIPLADASLRAGSWTRPMGNLLHHKSVGIIGCGRIGTHLAGLLKAFDCTIFGYDPYQLDESVFSPMTLDELLGRADIVSLHLPYSAETHHFMDAGRIGRMRKTALLINAARGGLIDETALVDALRAGKLGGAALDCFESEPYNGPLVDLNNVLLTSHIGSYAIEGRVNMEMTASANLVDELRKIGVLT